PALSVTSPPPSMTTSPRVLSTFAVACMRIVTGLRPHEKRISPPARTAAITAAEVQLRAVPCPTTRAGAAALVDAKPIVVASAPRNAVATARRPVIAGHRTLRRPMGGGRANILRGRQIVCVGFADWDAPLRTNQHHLMARLARANTVLFVESLGL